ASARRRARRQLDDRRRDRRRRRHRLRHLSLVAHLRGVSSVTALGRRNHRRAAYDRQGDPVHRDDHDARHRAVVLPVGTEVRRRHGTAADGDHGDQHGARAGRAAAARLVDQARVRHPGAMARRGRRRRLAHGVALMRARLSSFALLLASCAHPAPPVPQAPADPDTKFRAFLAQCRQQYADVDARIASAGVHDDEFFAVPGFPYVRTDRLMSAYRNEVSGDLNTRGTWMLQLRENDSIARDIELTNLGMPKFERADLLNTLRTCAVWLSFDELADPAT